MNFDVACDQTIKNEGVYDFDPNDTGGETVFGVSRNNFPKWQGWAIVDKYKSVLGSTTSNFRNALKADEALMGLVRAWYKSEFWNPFSLDDIEDYSLAFEVFDQAVNLGRSKVTQHIQKACNALNYKYAFGSDLGIDGLIGPLTRRRFVSIANDRKYTEVMRRALDGLQVSHYIALGLSSSAKSDYRKYTRGWLLNRVGKYNAAGLVA